MRAWRVLHAWGCGVSHEKSGLPYQDCSGWEDLASQEALALVIADGAGSASHAEVGASVAVTVALKMFRERAGERTLPETETGWWDLLEEGLQQAHAALCQEAEQRDLDLRSLATTLALAVATSSWVMAVQVGDGAIVVEEASGALHAVTAPPGGEYANETTFLTEGTFRQNAQRGRWQGEVAHVAAFTDGLQRLALKLPEGTPHPPFFAPLFRFAADLRISREEAQTQLEGFLRSPRLRERTDDDLTLILANRIDAK